MANWLSRLLPGRAAPLPRPALTESNVTTDGTGAVESMDMFSNAVTGLARHNSKTSCNRWDLEWGRSSWILENFFSFNALAARIITLEPKTALKKGFSVTGLEEDEVEKLRDFNRRRSFLSKFGQARIWERQFGGAILFMDVQDGLATEEPVDINRIETIGQLTPIDRYDLRIESFINDPLTGDMQTPEFYVIAQTSQRVHPSRVLEFRGIPTTSREIIRNQGWGGSELDRVFKAVERHDTTTDYLAEAVTRLTQGVLTIPSLKAAGTSDKKTGMFTRLKRLAQDMGLLGDFVLETGETYEVVQRGLNGFLDAHSVSRNAVVAASGIPDSILFGETKGGLNSGENSGDWQSVASDISGARTALYDPRISKYLRYVFASRQTPVANVPEIWDIEWPAIFETPAREQAEINRLEADASATLSTNGLITANEVRTNTVIAAAYTLGDLDPADQAQAEALVIPTTSVQPFDGLELAAE